jgi:hypothetical protein
VRSKVDLGPFLPDLPPAGQVIVATNVYPTEAGYTPVRDFQKLTPALPGISGGAAFVSSTGVTSFLSGTATDLYRYSSLTWASVLGSLAASRWRFAQFGDNVIAANGSHPISYDLLTGTAAQLAGNPPLSDMVTTVRDFVVVAGDPNAKLTVSWSGLNNSTIWNSTDDQADSQQMLDGGEVMGLAGGEYGVILQRDAIKRMTYVGPDIIFQFDTISSNIGCMAKGSVAQAGRLVFFLSERGFNMTDGNDVKPIGAEKIDRTLFATYSRQDIITGMYAAVDPTRNIVVWAMPGTPGMLWCYHWTLDRWTTIQNDTRLIFSGFTANISLDAVDAVFGNLDAVPISLDDAFFSGGNPLFLVGTSDGTVGTLSGDPKSATVGLARMELADDRARLRLVRLNTDATDVSVTVSSAARAGGLSQTEYSAPMRPNGDVPMRVNAREFVTRITVQGLWTYLKGVEFHYENGGRR